MDWTSTGAALRAALKPGGRARLPQREGSGPGAPRFSQTPTWRRSPPPETTTPPRAADGPGTAVGSAQKVSLLLSRPARGRRTTNPGFTYPAGRRMRLQRRSDSSLSRAPGADSACSPARASQGVQPAAPRSRRDPDSGDPPAPPDETHNGRRSWPLPCARTGAPPPTRQARARARAHPHRSLSALSRLFPRPARAAPRDVLEGAGPPRRPHPPGQPGRGVGSSAPSGVVGPGAD